MDIPRVLSLIVPIYLRSTAKRGIGLLLHDRPPLSLRTTLAAGELVLKAILIVWGSGIKLLSPLLDMLLGVGHITINLQSIRHALVLYKRSVTVDSITGRFNDLLANLDDLAHGNLVRIRRNFDAFCVYSRVPSCIEQRAYINPNGIMH